MEDSGGQKSAIPVINFPLALKMPLPSFLSQQSLVFRFSYHMTDTRNPGNMSVFYRMSDYHYDTFFTNLQTDTRKTF